jgi:hypothetical protein
MRAALFCALALLAASALPAASPPSSDPAAGGQHAKASSFVPHSGSHSRVYGAPIQQRILKNRPKPQLKTNPNPQLKTSPLPEEPAA